MTDKIMIDRDTIKRILSNMSMSKVHSRDGYCEEAMEELENLLKANPETKKGKCLICGAETNSYYSALDINYCATCWNSGKAAKHENNN
jgi:hypothetical protein